MAMNIEEILEQLDDMLDTAWAMPLSGGKVVVDGDRVRDLLDAIRANLPSEIRQARAIVNDRADIVDTAKKEAESIIRNAEEQRSTLCIGERADALEPARRVFALKHQLLVVRRRLAYVVL